MDIRLECLKLAHRNDLSPQEVIARASQYEQYVLGEQTKPEMVEQRRTRGRRPADRQERLTA